MGIVATNSIDITNLNLGKPAAVTDFGGRIRSISSTVEIGAGDSSTSTYRMARVPSNASVKHIYITNDAIGTLAAADVGLYRTAADGGAVVDADAYASAVSIAAAATTPVDVAFEARDIAKINNRVWQDAGATADTKTEYDIALTFTHDGTSAGTVSLGLEYVID